MAGQVLSSLLRSGLSRKDSGGGGWGVSGGLLSHRIHKRKERIVSGLSRPGPCQVLNGLFVRWT